MIFCHWLCSATSIDVEQTFSKGYILFPHVHNCFSAQFIHALLCLAEWSKLGFVMDSDLKDAASKPEVQDDEVLYDKDAWNKLLNVDK